MPRSTVSSAPRLARLQRQCALALALLLALPGGIGPVRAQPLPESRNALPSLGDSASEDFSVANERRGWGAALQW